MYPTIKHIKGMSTGEVLNNKRDLQGLEYLLHLLMDEIDMIASIS